MLKIGQWACIQCWNRQLLMETFKPLWPKRAEGFRSWLLLVELHCSRRPRLRQEPGLFETIANPAIPPFAICHRCSEHLLCDVKLKSCKQRQPSESNRTTMINKLMEHAFKFVYENKTITSYLKNNANQLINRLWGTPRLEPGTCWSAASRSYHWTMYPFDEAWINIIDCILLMSHFRKWASQLSLQMGCSGNWTRDLSHPKRESCH